MDKKDFYQLHSEFCKTLANPKRQEILDNLRHNEMSVGEIAEKVGITQANLSQHLAILRNNGIVAIRREGSTVYYSLANEKIIKAFDIISQVLSDSLNSQSKVVKAGLNRRK